MSKNKSIYYSVDELRSKQRVYNFIIGMRGNGKTYAMKKVCLNDFINKKQQFVWVRRYKTELDTDFQIGWASDIQQEFPDHEIKVTKKYIYLNNEIAGFIVALSTSQRKKSVSYNKVNKIVFDEFLITSTGGNLHYIKDEPVLFAEFYNTVDRWEDRTTAYFIANAFSVVNPYFVYHGVEVDISKRFTLNESICVEITHTPGVKEKALKTRHSKLMKGTKYQDYSIDSKFYNDDNEFLRKRQGNMLYMMSINYRDDKIGVWVGKELNGSKYWYCDNKIDPLNTTVISMTTQDMIEGARFKRSLTLDMYRRQIKNAFFEGRLYYSDLKIKKHMYEFVHML